MKREPNKHALDNATKDMSVSTYKILCELTYLDNNKQRGNWEDSLNVLREQAQKDYDQYLKVRDGL